MSGCRLEGLESRNCLAGLRDVCAPMGVSAGLLEEVSCETFVLAFGTCLHSGSWAPSCFFRKTKFVVEDVRSFFLFS